MQSKATTPAAYVASLPEEQKGTVQKLRQLINKNLPKGFEEMMSYGMMGWAVPHSLYPGGYHCDPKQPLPFMGLAAQKNSVNLYHMGIYSDPKLLEWFTTSWKKQTTKKLDMGKSCIRFKKAEDIPWDLIGELATKMSPKDWIELYGSMDPRNKKK